VKLLPPDYDAGSSRHGGYLAEIPEPHVRMFPGPRKRVVRVMPARIFRHYHTSMREQDNPIWDGRPKRGVLTGPAWTTAWDDDEGKGRTLFEIFDNLTQVGLWVAKMTKLYFPAKTHEVIDDFNYMSGDPADEPEYMRIARDAAQRAARREGD
jgi:hypothetical protein